MGFPLEGSTALRATGDARHFVFVGFSPQRNLHFRDRRHEGLFFPCVGRPGGVLVKRLVQGAWRAPEFEKGAGLKLVSGVPKSEAGAGGPSGARERHVGTNLRA